MWPWSLLQAFRIVAVTFVLTAIASLGAVAPRDSESSQARILADLVAGILRCSPRPCLGTSIKELKTALGGRIAADGVDYHSDLAIAYPAAADALQGVVRWDLGEGVDAIAMTIVDFSAPPPVVRAELEDALPGCEMEGDTVETTLEGGDVESEDEIAENEWSCTTEQDEDEADIYIYFARDILVLEIDP